MVWSAELYSAEPKPTFGITLAVLGGTGIFSSTFCADTCLLKFAITLMLIFSVVSLHARALAAARALRLLLVGNQQLVVEAEAALGHARQVRLHHDLAHHLAAQHRARLRDQQVHALQRVDEDLVLAVRDALAAPTPYGY